MSSKKGKQNENKRCSYPVIKRSSPSPILQVSEANSTSFDTTANTIKPLQIFSYLTIKRKCYAFQLLKQFILFSDDSDSQLQDSFQYNHSPYKPIINLQQVQEQLESLCSVIKRARQKLLLSAYERLKKRYFKRKMVYRNREYVENIVEKILNLIRDEHQEVMQYVFGGLVKNMKQGRLKEIVKRNGGEAVNIPQQIEYEDKMFKTREYLPFHTDQQSGIMKNDTQSFFESDSRIRIAKDFGIRKFKNQSTQTPLKHPEFSQQLPTTRQKSTITSSKQFTKQLIYIVGSGRKYSFSKDKRPQPDRHIKIPIESSNVDIVRIEGLEQKERRDKENRREKYFKRISEQFVDENCQRCEYCVKIRLSQEIMDKVRLGRKSAVKFSN